MAELHTPGGRTLYYDATGEGPPLLLLMGGGESRRMWASQVRAFASGFRVIAIDNRDTGESPPETSPYTVTDMAGDAAALLDGLGMTRAHVLGTSMGGMIALQLALDQPTRVDRLVLLSTPTGGVQFPAPPREAWPADHADWIRGLFPMLAAPGHFDANPAALEELAALGRENNVTYEGALRQIEAINRFDARDRLGEIAAPTLLVVGDHDPQIALADAQAWVNAMPNARLVVIPGAGHLAFVERAEDVNRAVLEFLRG